MTKAKPDSSFDLLENPWHHIYWFARMLINSDRFGGIGKDSKKMVAVAAAIQTAIDNSSNITDKVKLLKNVISKTLLHNIRQTTKNIRKHIN